MKQVMMYKVVAKLVRRLASSSDYHTITEFLSKGLRVRVTQVGRKGWDFRVNIGEPNYNEVTYMRKAHSAGLEIRGMMYFKRYPKKRRK